MGFEFYRQPDQMDCGPTCLRMLAKHYGRSISLEKLRKLTQTNREGSSLKFIADAAETIGFRTLGVKVSLAKLEEEFPLPCILHWNQYHFVVLYKIHKNKFYVADPAHGLLVYSRTEFLENWIGANATETTDDGIALIVEPTPKLRETEYDDAEKKKGLSFIYQYLFRYKKFLLQLALGLFAGSILQLIFPFLTQSVVDVGIQNQDINFVYLILIAQLLLFLGRASIEIIRAWILLHLSTRINISLVSDFFIKLMKLPISFFDIKMTGDIMQRISDHQRIESLLTSNSLNVLFSLFNLVIFGVVLAWYDWRIFSIFFIGSLFYIAWIMLFLKKRRDLDYKRFSQLSDEQSKVIELINGMQEIKLHNAEKQKRWSWEFLQARLFKISVESLSLEQIQTVGSGFINEVKNIFISFFAVQLVIDGEITLGMMMAVSYIIGQLNGPIIQLVGFIYALQDARIALDRLSEIHNKEEEEDGSEKVYDVPIDAAFKLKDFAFQYIGSTKPVFEALNLEIQANKVTAIVGASGSGKTTLMKLLLKFYEPTKGEVLIGNHHLKTIAQQAWREQCGVVMQEGYIFNDTIANNIAIGKDSIDIAKLKRAADIANISEYIEQLPLGYNTKVGAEGQGMSTGQKQRLLIARAIYKDPKFVFFDEATSALDAKNERQIMEKLNTFFKDRTVVVIAHRLSTVKNADQIIVLEEGAIKEYGTHEKLVENKGTYYNLVKNQLELGN